MEFVDGASLRQLLDARKLSPQEALAIVPQICDALQYAHNAGVVHRDIKPENILLDKNGPVKIADFGLAKLMGRDPKDLALTGTGQVMGTPHYMAPEQLEHPQEVDHRADIYSLGVVFYQMLTGELPIGRFAPPSTKVQIDVRLDEVVLRALEKEPDRRYQQVSEVKTRVETIVQTSPAAAAPPPAATGTPGESGAEAAGGPSTWPRFSRLAIAGAVWASFFLTVPVFVFSYFTKPGPLGPEPVPVPPLQQALGTLVILLVVVISASVATAPFGATILGAVSISQIRHSAGRLYGLGLALFDALLFPLLALDAVIGVVAIYVASGGRASTAAGAPGATGAAGAPAAMLFIGFGILLVLGINYLIVRWAWRAANRPVGASPRGRATLASAGPAPSAADRPPPNGTGVALAWIALGLFMAGLLGGAALGALKAEAGMIFGLLCECLALVFGILGRRHRAGKVALIGWAVLVIWCFIQYIIFLIMRDEAFNRHEFQHSSPVTHSSHVTTTAKGAWRVQWGEQGRILRYIAFVKDGTREPRELVSVSVRPPEPTITLAVSEDRAEPLPSSANVFELIDGRFRQEWVDVSVDLARQFCGSKQVEYTIDSLKAYLKQPVGGAQSQATPPPPASRPHDQPAPSNAASSAFGPVIERTVNYATLNRLGKQALDLSTGKQWDLPPAFGHWPEGQSVFDYWPEEQFQKWIAENHVDVLADVRVNTPSLMIFGGKLAAIAAERWDTIRPEELRAALAANGLGPEVVTIYMSCRLPQTAKLPLTRAFQTRNGKLGILQITGIVGAQDPLEKPHGIRIRYKLAQTAGGAQSQTTSWSNAVAEGPTVAVTAKYPGASAQVVADTVAAPIEQQVNGVEWMLRLESESRNDGTYTAWVRFKPRADAKAALTLVKNRVALAKPMLPEAVQHAGVAVETKATEKAENRVTIVLVDRGQVGGDALRRFSEAVLERLSADGAIVSPETFPGPEGKRVHVQIDRAKCREYSVPLAEVTKAVDAARGRNSDGLESLEVRSAKGNAVSLGKLVTIELVSGPAAVYRVDMYPAVRITGAPPAGKIAESAAARCAELADAERNVQDRPAGFAVLSGF
jgi:hypothetical protein